MLSRRRFALGAGALTLGVLPSWALPRAAEDDRIFVVVELSGGNDGLNCVVPYGDDAYYRARPNLGIPREQLRVLDDHFGLNPGMLGFERLWQDGDLAIVHGCGYENPSFSHFTSMAYWHTGAPHGGSEYGWVGRLADAMRAAPEPNFIINIGPVQSMAVTSRYHSPVVFDDPARFQRRGFARSQELQLDYHSDAAGNPTREFLNQVAQSAREGSARIRAACESYRTPVDYGIAPIDLNKVAACIADGLPTRLYYVSFRNNAFDTHVQQADLHQRLLSYACDAIHGFLRDMARLGQDDRVVVMAFSEFGRRVPENANLGTDHGAAGPMFLAGKPVRGGHYGEPPSLTQLDAGDNLLPTVDFRSVYATAIDGWIAPGASNRVLDGNFAPLNVFA